MILEKTGSTFPHPRFFLYQHFIILHLQARRSEIRQKSLPLPCLREGNGHLRCVMLREVNGADIAHLRTPWSIFTWQKGSTKTSLCSYWVPFHTSQCLLPSQLLFKITNVHHIHACPFVDNQMKFNINRRPPLTLFPISTLLINRETVLTVY